MSVTAFLTKNHGAHADRAVVQAQHAAWPALVSAIVAFVVAVALSAPPVLQLVEIREPNLYIHVGYAQNIARTGVLYPGHFLFHLLVVAAHATLPVSWLQASIIAVLALRGVLAVVVWRVVYSATLGANSASGMLFTIVVALALTMASAVNVLTWNVGNYYLGYITPNLYVSQTLIVLQPLALVLFFVTLRVLEWSGGVKLRDVVLMSALAVLSILAKPSYAMVLLPAVALLILIRGQIVHVNWTEVACLHIRRGRWLRDLRPPLILCAGLALPVLMGILWVYGSTYLIVHQLSLTEGIGILLAPFKVMGFYQQVYNPDGRTIAWLFMKFLLSILFPVAVAASFWSELRCDSRLILAWLQFGVGVLFMYLLAEDPAFQNGNFTWSAHIALFILFVVSMLVVIESLRTDGRTGWRLLADNKLAVFCFGVFVLHLIGGYGIFAYPHVN